MGIKLHLLLADGRLDLRAATGLSAEGDADDGVHVVKAVRRVIAIPIFAVLIATNLSEDMENLIFNCVELCIVIRISDRISTTKIS